MAINDPVETVPVTLPVTVVVPCFDAAATIAATIESVLVQTFQHFELIVVDQSETDTTSESLRSACADPRLHYVRSKFVGVSRGRNEGVRHATMESVLITDDDVTVPQGWVEHFAGALMLHDRVGVAFCRVDSGEHDPAKGFIPDNVINRDTLVRHLAGKQGMIEMTSVDLDEGVAQADATVILTDHDCIDYSKIVRDSKLIVDTRNATKKVTFGKDKIWSA